MGILAGAIPVPPPAMTPRRPVPRFLVPLLAFLLLGGIAAPSWAQDDGGNGGSSTDELGAGTELKAEYDEVLGAEAKLEEAADLAAQRRARILGDITTVQEQLAVTRTQLDAATLRFQAAVVVRNRTRAQLRAAERRVSRARNKLRAQAVSSYVAGGTGNDTLAVLIGSADDVSATGRTLSYANAVVDHQEDLIRAFNDA